MRDLGLFKGLRPGSVDWLLGAATSVRHASGTVVVNEGDEANAIHLVSSGVYTARINCGDLQHEVGRLGVGSVFGEMAWLGDTVASATVVAAEAGETLVVSVDALEAKLREDARFAAEFMRALAGVMVERQRASNATAVNLSVLPALANASKGEFTRLNAALASFREAAARYDKEERMKGGALAETGDTLSKAFAQIASNLEETCRLLAPRRPAAADAVGARVQAELLPYLLATETSLRCYAKPRGYAGDFETIDRIYQRRAGGVGVGSAIDGVFLDQPAAKAVRNRRTLIADRIVSTARARPGAAITSLACGPAREVSDAFATLAEEMRPSVTLMDSDADALHAALARLGDEGFGASVTAKAVNFVRLALGRERVQLPPQDLIYAVGLIDYFSDEFVVLLLDWVHDRLAPGGSVILGNFHPRNPVRALMDHVLDWRLIHRSDENLQRLFAASAFGTCEEMLVEGAGVNIFGVARRGG